MPFRADYDAVIFADAAQDMMLAIRVAAAAVALLYGIRFIFRQLLFAAMPWLCCCHGGADTIFFATMLARCLPPWLLSCCC